MKPPPRDPGPDPPSELGPARAGSRGAHPEDQSRGPEPAPGAAAGSSVQGAPLPRFDVPQRPTGRGYRLARCSGCRAPEERCFCVELRPVDSQVRVLVILHALEQFRPTNTGRYATQILRGSELRIRGGRSSAGVPMPLDLSDLDPGDPGTLLLHPGPEARLLDEHFAPPPGPIRLVVPDGTWTQTRQMLRREPRLKALSQIALPRGKPSIYALRRGVTPDGLCTLEAIARALRALGEGAAADELERVLLIAVRVGMAARGYHDWQPPR
ncbi:MAG: DTW domain-containing protein [Myxococcales bacterium]|nr:DTW domain-containing protein [Myxococcales bacterium]